MAPPCLKRLRQLHLYLGVFFTPMLLFFIGTDQLKGFAVTLILGLVLNLFTAVFCSRVMFDVAERNGWVRRLNMAKLFGTPDFRFVRWVQTAIAASALFILAGLAASLQRGQGLFDIDFTGGTSVQVAFRDGQAPDIAEVRAAVREPLTDTAVSAVTVPVAGTSVGFDRTISPEYAPLPLSPAADVPPQNHEVVMTSPPGTTGVPEMKVSEKAGVVGAS